MKSKKYVILDIRMAKSMPKSGNFNQKDAILNAVNSAAVEFTDIVSLAP